MQCRNSSVAHVPCAAALRMLRQRWPLGRTERGWRRPPKKSGLADGIGMPKSTAFSSGIGFYSALRFGEAVSISRRLRSAIVNTPTLLNRLNRLHNAFVEQAWLVERHIVRGPLEPLQDILWSTELLEVVGRQIRIDVPIVAAKEEVQGNVDCAHFLAHIDAQQLRMHGPLGDMKSFDEPRYLPRCCKAEQYAVNDNGGAVARLEVNTTVARCDPLECSDLVDRFIGRHAKFSQFSDRIGFVATLGLRQVEVIFPALLLAEGHQRRHADQRRHGLGVRLSMEQTEHGAPRMADEIDLLFGIRLAQIVDDDIEVFQVLRDSQPSGVGRPIKRASRATLIEVGHKEVALQTAVEIAKQRPLGTARPAVQPEQQWRTPIGPPDFHVKLSAANLDAP